MASLLRKLPIRRLRTLSSPFPLPTCPSRFVLCPTEPLPPISRVSSSSFFFSSSPTPNPDEALGPASIDYRSILAEDEFHKLADETLHGLQEKFEEYGDEIQLDGFDIDYGNHVLTLKLGDMGTYVINKQTPNRQVWLSSPVSGPSRFDWDVESKSWVYRRTKANLFRLLEDEVTKLCGRQISLS
ncbi:frataxin, mitochondrial [Iris pallida]|uniref:ferroxidase n=1 Tax=Iris pallida TaxID=29817 RepID=A0AAX6FMV6_IRIPA|nr:frataxin, mitochondrial [Iris pallida]